MNLSTDIAEISSSKLLQLIATRLLDTNEVNDGVIRSITTLHLILSVMTSASSVTRVMLAVFALC